MINKIFKSLHHYDYHNKTVRFYIYYTVIVAFLSPFLPPITTTRRTTTSNNIKVCVICYHQDEE